MAISSASTNAEVLAEAEDNADYSSAGSVAKCKAFIHAAKILILRRPGTIADAHGRQLSFSLIFLDREVQRAEDWLARAGGADGSSSYGNRRAGVVHKSLEGFRS